MNRRFDDEWLTVEQWEKRTGKVYPDDGPVWRDRHRENRLRGSRDFIGLYLWELFQYNGWNPEISIVPHIGHGKPPADGKGEE